MMRSCLAKAPVTDPNSCEARLLGMKGLWRILATQEREGGGESTDPSRSGPGKTGNSAIDGVLEHGTNWAGRWGVK